MLKSITMLKGVYLGLLFMHMLAVVHSFFLDTSLNTQCQIPIPYPATPIHNYDHTVVRLILDHAVLVEKIHIKVDNCPERQLAHIPFMVNYQDASDITNASRPVLKGMKASWVRGGTILELALPLALYTNYMVLSSPSIGISCSKFLLVGCETEHMCQGHPELCGNVGTCIGSGRCLCPDTLIGATCNKPIANMTVDGYEPIVLAGDTLYTNGAVFDIRGDMELITSSRKRHGHHDMHFYGGGGSMTYSNHHNGGFSGGGSIDAYPSSHSPSSGFGHPKDGYSHSCNVMFGDHHDHHHHSHYMFSTHGDHHYSPGSSMHYHDGHVHMHVHEHHHDDHHHPDPHHPDPHHDEHHHYHVSFPFTPHPGHHYDFGCSFSPHFGASVMLNGFTVGSQTSPSVSNPPPGNNSTASQVSGLDILNMFGTHARPHWLEAALQPPTIPPPATTPAGQQMSTNIPPAITTLPTAPSTTQVLTLPPVSATSGSPNGYKGTTVASGVGPLCHDCKEHMPTEGACTNITQCYKDEVCVAFQDPNGYVHRCMDEKVCLASQQLNANQCWYCCAADLCNSHCLSSGVYFNPKTTSVPVTTMPTPTTTAAQVCNDTPQCGQLQAVGYGVCQDRTISETMCRASCNTC